MLLPSQDVHLHLRAPVWRALAAMWHDRGSRATFANFLVELLEVNCAGYRLQKSCEPTGGTSSPVTGAAVEDPRYHGISKAKIHMVLQMRGSLTQAEIAVRSGLSQSSVSRIVARADGTRIKYAPRIRSGKAAGHPRALTNEQVEEIAGIRRSDRDVSFVGLARRYGCSQSTIRRALLDRALAQRGAD
jgi:hypothetical protein